MYIVAKACKLENSREITRQNDQMFYYEMQRGVLLSLKDQGTINEAQFRKADFVLKEQCRENLYSRVNVND